MLEDFLKFIKQGCSEIAQPLSDEQIEVISEYVGIITLRVEELEVVEEIIYKALREIKVTAVVDGRERQCLLYGDTYDAIGQVFHG